MKKRNFVAFVAIMLMTTVSCATVNAANQNSALTKVCKDSKREYVFDEKGRVIKEIIYANSKNTLQKEPYAAYFVVYGTTENTLIYAKYNSAQNAFNIDCQQQTFDAKDFPEIIKAPKQK